MLCPLRLLTLHQGLRGRSSAGCRRQHPWVLLPCQEPLGSSACSTGHQPGGRVKPSLCPVPRNAAGLSKLGTQCPFQAGM